MTRVHSARWNSLNAPQQALRKRIAELEENNKLLRAKIEKYLKLLEELDPDPRNLAERLK